MARPANPDGPAGAAHQTAAPPPAAAAPAGPPARDDPPAPPGPGRWRWNAAEGRHEKLIGEG
jgi:hypothetical protein